jgi:hypothetical protein
VRRIITQGRENKAGRENCIAENKAGHRGEGKRHSKFVILPVRVLYGSKTYVPWQNWLSLGLIIDNATLEAR